MSLRPDSHALALIDDCTQASLALLQRNLTPHGILAASRTDAAAARRYTRIFGRDAAICVMAMCGSGVDALEKGAVASLDALVGQQAPSHLQRSGGGEHAAGEGEQQRGLARSGWSGHDDE